MITDQTNNRLGQLLTLEVLEELDKLWPDRCPAPNDTSMVIKCAQRQVINVLWTKFWEINDPSRLGHTP